MSSSPRSDRPEIPSSLVILPSERFIGDKLEAICRMDPCADGGIEVINVDQQPVPGGGAVSNLLATGYEEVHAVDDGLCVHFMDGVIARDWRITARGLGNCVRLRIPFTGTADFVSTEARVSDQGSRCTFVIQPAGAGLTGVYQAHLAYRYCTINLSQRYMEDILGVTVAELPRPLASGWANQETAFGHIILSRPALTTAARFFNLSSQGAMRRIEVHAIALDLLRQILEAWVDVQAVSRTRVSLRPSERDQLMRLRGIADARSPDPISMAEAVQLTGLNKNKIHVGFNQFFGMSLRDYCFDRRMQRARSLLLGTQMSIADVADAVGFSEPTNFTNTFRKHFATLPSDLRRGGKLPD